jgi:hypothetical protein
MKMHLRRFVSILVVTLVFAMGCNTARYYTIVPEEGTKQPNEEILKRLDKVLHCAGFQKTRVGGNSHTDFPTSPILGGAGRTTVIAEYTKHWEDGEYKSMQVYIARSGKNTIFSLSSSMDASDDRRAIQWLIEDQFRSEIRDGTIKITTRPYPDFR